VAAFTRATVSGATALGAMISWQAKAITAACAATKTAGRVRMGSSLVRAQVGVAIAIE